MIELHLPLLPPSANAMWTRTKAGMRISDSYKSWLRSCIPIANAQRRGRTVSGPYTLRLALTKPKTWRSDVDNRIKCSNDLLVKIGAVQDDSLCESVTAHWRVMGQGVTITVESFSGV